MNWNSILTVLFAFIGGGAVTLIVDLIRQCRRSITVRALFLTEIRLNTEMAEGTLASYDDYQFSTHFTWTSFYDANSIELTAFNSKTADEIINFYGFIGMLRRRDEENKEIDRLHREGKHDAADRFQENLGKLKKEIRQEMTKLGGQIINEVDSSKRRSKSKGKNGN